MKKLRPIDISVILPVFNEAENLDNCQKSIAKTLENICSAYEILYVNDGSTDDSLDIIKQLAKKNNSVKYLDLSRNFGQQAAISAGLEYCSGNRIVIMDADMQDPPELIAEMNQKMDEGFDVVYGKRKTRKGESFLKKFTARLFYRLLARITNVKIPMDTGDFRMISRKVADILKKMPERDRFIRGQVAWIGFKQTYVSYEREGRKKGRSAWSYKQMIRFAIDGITSFSDFPLRFATFLGIIVSFVSFILILWALYQRFIAHSYVQGWTSLILSVLFLGGVQLLSLGIIGEYISRIGSNVRRRPRYVINEKNTETEDETLDEQPSDE
ncbi:MAG: glycosyltransferase family 2 protein [Bacteroidales bacterium]|jgi:glycosyltransferase involved in cell wall biosynthesis|nr:glycosyltransferase family 2 protein [Bacteroidales bacterium]